MIAAGARDSMLIKAIGLGDVHALRLLFERHAPLLEARLRHRCGDLTAVEDALQETFLAVWRASDSYRGSGAVGAWLWGIARRQLVNQLRRSRRPAAIAFGDQESRIGSDTTDVIETWMDVMKRLDDLDADLRDIVLLIAIEDRTTVEVSELLGIPVGTVKSRLHRARRILRGASEDL